MEKVSCCALKQKIKSYFGLIFYHDLLILAYNFTFNIQSCAAPIFVTLVSYFFKWYLNRKTFHYMAME